MPFTLVHPAAVLPLARTPLVPSALVIGAMAPDLPYYVSLRVLGGDANLTLTHQWTSLLWFDPLLALVLLAAFQAVLKRPLAALLPTVAAGRVQAALDGFRWRTLPAVLWILLSVTLGATTHLAWDALTDAFGGEWSTRLNLGSDAVGGVALVVWLVLWWRRTPPRPIPPRGQLPRRLRVAVLVAVVAVALAWGAVSAAGISAQVEADLRAYGEFTPAALAEYQAREFAIGAATAFGAAVGLYAVAWQASRLIDAIRRRRRAIDPAG